MSILEQLFNIPELQFTDDEHNMSDLQFEKFVEVLNVFIVSFPTKEMKLKTSLVSKNVDMILKHLVDIGEMLRGIHAKALADECWRRLNSFDRNKPERIEAYVSFLCSSVNALSIDIQMALTPKESRPTSAEAITNQPSEHRVNKSVLAVDDDVYCLHLFKAALKEVPCKIIAVNSGKEALTMLNKIRPHLFVLDIDMPGMTGIDLARTLRAQGQYSPIIFLTGNATKEYVQECLSVGASDFIVKPINPENVANRVRRYLG